MTQATYFIKEGYRSRREPEYFVDENLNAVWQPDLYPEAATIARRLGVHRIIDVGCGTAGKLATLHPEFDIVGIDYGSNIEVCQARYDFGTWIDVDLDTSQTLGWHDVAASVLVCGDVIEHLLNPENLLRLLRRALDDGAAALLLTTPDRELTNEPGHLGPPPNHAHVREWAIEELKRFMESEGLVGFFGLTRSNDVMPYLRTILAAIPGENTRHKEILRDWFVERQKWQHLAEHQDRLIAGLHDWSHDLQAAKDWAEEQRATWQREAETALQQVAELTSNIQAMHTHAAELEQKLALYESRPRNSLKHVIRQLARRMKQSRDARQK